MAEKPSGITTGDGTQAHPWEVHSYEELKWCCEDAEAIPEGQTATSGYVYIKLVNDIDCQEYDVDFLWSITTTHAVDINLNTKTIKTFYIAAKLYMFNSNTFGFEIHDGKILNVYGHWESESYGLFSSSSSSVYFKVTNISFSIDLSKIHSVFYHADSSTANHIVKNCSFWIQGFKPVNNNLGPLNRSAQAFSCCDFELYGDLTKPFTNTGMFDPTSSLYTNCRFQGTIYWYVSTTAQYLFYSTCILRNCVWAATITATNPSAISTACYLSNSTSSSTYGICNVDLVDSKLVGFLADRRAANIGIIECHNEDMDMRYNPNADQRLIELGFDVIKG